MSNRIGPNEPLRTTEDLARHLGLSRWTVSRALNGHPGVSRRTREKIERLAKARRFQPSLIAATLRSGRAPILGTVIPHLEAYRLGAKLTRLEAVTPSLGLRLVVGMSGGHPEREAEALQNLAALRPTGLIQFASGLPPHHPARDPFNTRRVPVIQIDPLHEGHPLTVVSDRARATELALDHLLDHGCTTILLFGFPPRTAYGRARWTGIRRSLRRHRLALGTGAKSFWLGREASDTSRDGETYVTLARPYLRSRRRHPVGIMTMNDTLALGALRALLREGFQPGHDVKIIGYDAADFTGFTTPPLSTVDPCGSELVEAAIHLLETARNAGLTQQPTLRIEPRLIARESTLGPTPEPSPP